MLKKDFNFTRSSCSMAACTGNRFERTNFGWIPSISDFEASYCSTFCINVDHQIFFTFQMFQSLSFSNKVFKTTAVHQVSLSSVSIVCHCCSAVFHSFLKNLKTNAEHCQQLHMFLSACFSRHFYIDSTLLSSIFLPN